ncbi:MAG: hypothetical protein ABSF34_09230, partial [Verrucomicrobiota bacterium]
PAAPPATQRMLTNASQFLRSLLRRRGGWWAVKKAKLPNEPNLKTAPPAIPASREGQPNEIYNMLTFNILQINTKPLAASEISLKRQKNPI